MRFILLQASKGQAQAQVSLPLPWTINLDFARQGGQVCLSLLLEGACTVNLDLLYTLDFICRQEVHLIISQAPPHGKAPWPDPKGPAGSALKI